MTKSVLYKICKSVVPCILLTLCIGFCYAFSLFIPHIAAAIGASTAAVQFTFCLNIFFLGMGAALFGPLVERRIKIASTVSSLMLFSGLVLSGIGCIVGSIWPIYIGAGVLCGIAEGCGYVVPNKNMLLWWGKSKHKGIVMAFSIMSFGFGSALCSWLFGMLFPALGIAYTFFALAGIYLVLTGIATLMINKPKYALAHIKKNKSTFSYIESLKDPLFRYAWLFMFFNISMGLILIGTCASLLSTAGIAGSMLIFTMAMCGIFNGGGRLVFPWISDYLKNRSKIWLLVAGLEVLFVAIALCWTPFVPFAIVLINATYGAAFATLPSILESKYGKSNLSQIHGFCLTSWGIASLFAYLCTRLVFGYLNGTWLLVILGAIYMLNMYIAKKVLEK